jgi:hypothetical protein
MLSQARTLGLGLISGGPDMSICIAGGNYAVGITERAQRCSLPPEGGAIAGRLVFQSLEVLPGAAVGSGDGSGLRVAPSQDVTSLVAVFGNLHDRHQSPVIGCGMTADPAGGNGLGSSPMAGTM